MKASRFFILLFIGIIVIPSMIFAGTTFRVDMDANTAGYQDTILLLPGQSFTSNVEVIMDGAGDSLSSFGYSVWWDTGELTAPSHLDINTSPLASGWLDFGPGFTESPYIYNFKQARLSGSTSGPLISTVASITWTANNPASDVSLDINVGFFHILDEAYDAGNSLVTPTFVGGKVNLAPEPISSTLFLAGAAALGFRRFRKKLKK